MTDDLNPCPFCGGDPRMESAVIEASVRCVQCRAKIIMPHAPDYDCGDEDAIAAWNRRAMPVPESVKAFVKSGAFPALLNYSQADMDGIMVHASRQAIEECADFIRETVRAYAEQAGADPEAAVKELED